jgi:DeoR/GlpR family transcriptional regulator of sugar metabolism
MLDSVRIPQMKPQSAQDHTAKIDAVGRPALPLARRRAIADQLERDGAVTVAELERRFGVSSMTARRDLAELERAGLARRTHGGAVVPGFATHEDSFQHRVGVEVERKERIAAVAAGLVQPHETVFADSSSTAWYAVRALLARRIPVTLVTNAVPVMELASADDAAHVELNGIGGSLRRLTRSFVGPHAVRMAREHYADTAFLSVKGVMRDGILADADPLEAEVKRALIGHAGAPLLLADGSKLLARGFAAIAPAHALARAVVADATPAGLALLADADVDVLQA